ncbi:hypothetical protein FQN51_004651 [Onygenales sp. PD_10]|nr:hypothetical protein FQN51_004651 [Onygenales sp. PD_10]
MLTDEYAEQSDSDILESLGYVTGSASPLAREVLGTSPSDNAFFHTSTICRASNDPRRSRETILELFPERHVVNFLIQYFLHEVNWAYEMIYPPTFMEKYTSWWLQTVYQESEDVQFGILILRLCLCSIQLLPHPNYPHEGTFQCSLRELQSQCEIAVNGLDSLRPRSTSLTRIQHMFYHASFLMNESNLRESWIVLSDIVKESHMIELHLENPRIEYSEFEMEMRRRVFGTIHMWDKFMSALQGHWPLIPEAYCDIGLPRDALYAAPSVPGAPTPFTDRIIQMQLARLRSTTAASQEHKSNIPDPTIISDSAESIHAEVTSTLPPAYRLSDFDQQFDNILPSIPLKREQLRVIIIGTLATIHRPFTGMQHDPNFTDLPSAKDRRTAFKLQKNLIEYSIDVVRTIIRLAHFLPGGCKRFFLLSLTAMEASVVLGLCLRGLRRNRRAYLNLSHQGLAANTENSELETPAYAVFLEGLGFLDELANYSAIAAKGSKIVNSLHEKLQRDATMDAEHEVYTHATTQFQQQAQHVPVTWGTTGAGMVAPSEQAGDILGGVPVGTSSTAAGMGIDPYAWSQMAAAPDMGQFAQPGAGQAGPELTWYYDDTLVQRYATSTL